MKYETLINGIEVSADYSEDNIEKIFLPLIRRLNMMQKEKGGRILVMLAAPPGAGKSTLASFLAHLSEKDEESKPITVIGMDGFHHYQSYILSHTINRDGKEIQMIRVKGAPETFDLEKLKEYTEKISRSETCRWPIYDRMIHDPAEGEEVKGDIILLEGNYLLLQDEGWRDLRNYADYTVRIRADEKLLRQRLVERKLKGTMSYAHALAFVENSDLYNARTVEKRSAGADLMLKLNDDNTYSII